MLFWSAWRLLYDVQRMYTPYGVAQPLRFKVVESSCAALHYYSAPF